MSIPPMAEPFTRVAIDIVKSNLCTEQREVTDIFLLTVIMAQSIRSNCSYDHRH